MHFSPTNYITSIRTNNNIEDLILIQVVLKIMLVWQTNIIFSPTYIHFNGTNSH